MVQCATRAAAAVAAESVSRLTSRSHSDGLVTVGLRGSDPDVIALFATVQLVSSEVFLFKFLDISSFLMLFCISLSSSYWGNIRLWPKQGRFCQESAA